MILGIFTDQRKNFKISLPMINTLLINNRETKTCSLLLLNLVTRFHYGVLKESWYSRIRINMVTIR